MTRITVALGTFLLTSGCFFGDINLPDVDTLPDLDTGGGTDSTGPGATSTIPGESATSQGTSGASDGTSTSGSVDSTGGESSDSSGTTGEPAEDCILPHGPAYSWCAAQREVAQILGCKTSANPAACYQTIVAQYDEGSWEVLAAGDCDTAVDGPECATAYSACTNASGPNGCHLRPGDDVQDCVDNALAQGLTEALATGWCEAIAAVWITGCTTRTQYVACDPMCALPCSNSRECLGPAGQEACTAPCADASECAPTGLPAPWDAPVCADSACAAPCIDGACGTITGTCNANGSCWPF